MKGSASKESSISTKIIIILLVISLGINTYLLIHKRSAITSSKTVTIANSDQKIKDIEQYLDTISSSYIADEQELAKENNLPSWGCGPSSYALAKILNKKFFNNTLVIDASYNNKNPYEIIERFGLAQGKNALIDHAWLEIYFQDKFLFIDPSIGQFGKVTGIAYQVFTVGQSDLKDILKTKYNIEDVRLSLLVPKVVNRIPVSQEPYPGMTINQNDINYFLQVVEDRNNVNDGIEPDEWQSWVSILTDKYL